ncbi:MAG: type II toxin-antitoxin system VapC family toxin [Deltaproteobacteria bacterium]|nr:type II toxin-antitoxin system VapC family toxin [Deltaproteobacteria bacterium]
MIYYFDTSALLKKYFLEEGTPQVMGLFAERGPIVCTCFITSVEGYHGIYRKKKEGSLSNAIIQKVIKQFQKDLRGFKIVNSSEKIISLAQKIIQKTTLKTLDSLHVASALLIKRMVKSTVTFVSYDVQQKDVADKFGLKIF